MVIDELFPLCYEFTGEWVSPLEMNAQKLMLPFGADLSILKAGLPGLQFSYEGLVHTANDVSAVSYTHLDVYKRQGRGSLRRVYLVYCNGYLVLLYGLI